MLREAGTEPSTPVSHHALEQHLGESHVPGPSCAKALRTHCNSGLFLSCLAMSVRWHLLPEVNLAAQFC